MSLTHVSTYNLSVVLKRIKQIILTQTQNKQFWVKAQVSKINNDRRGNHYLELIESEDATVIAKCEAIIWANQYVTIESELKNETKNILKNGAEILCYASIEYSEVYGLRLQITAIDLNYSLGEIERRKQENILLLQKNGLINKNKQTQLPVVIQKIALIGSPNTAGYADFTKQLQANEYGFDFLINTYPCAVQGEKALAEIISQLRNILISNYDAIVIVRGGGSKFDLEIFNDLDLAQTIANIPIPVLTGIGHETDLSIADIVAHNHFKTPTALASYIIDRAHSYLLQIQNTFQQITQHCSKLIKENKHTLDILAEQIKSNSQNKIRAKQNHLQLVSNRVTFISQDSIANYRVKLNMQKDKIDFLSQAVIKNKRIDLKNHASLIETYTKQHLQQQKTNINNTANLVKHWATQKINNQKQRIEKLVHIPDAYNPQQILNLGYAIIRKNGKVIPNNYTLQNGDQIEIELANKIINVTITDTTEKTKWKDIHTKLQQQN